MASVFQRAGRWYLRVNDEAGVWRKIPSSARTKTEARRFAEDLERRSERQRLGLEPLPLKDGGGTLAEATSRLSTSERRSTDSSSEQPRLRWSQRMLNHRSQISLRLSPRSRLERQKARIQCGGSPRHRSEKLSGPSRIRTWDQSVMSAEVARSIECQRVLPSGKPMEFQERAEPVDVHAVPGSPSITDRFGSYLVPSLPIGQLFTVKDLAARWAVCTATIYALVKSGRLESLRIGNSLRFTAAVVVCFEQARVGAKPERRPRKTILKGT